MASAPSGRTFPWSPVTFTLDRALSNVPIHGTLPGLVGQVVDRFVVEAFVVRGELVSSANVAYVLSAGTWFRFAIDHGSLHCRSQFEPPAPWEEPDEGWSYPHQDLGPELGLPSPLEELAVGGEWPNVRVEFSFTNGRRVVLFSSGDSNSYHAV